MLLPSNTDRMVVKRRSQGIWMPRGKAGIETPALETNLATNLATGNKNWHHESSSSRSFQNRTEKLENFLCDVTSGLQGINRQSR
ncbi:hypothetical protein NPIL_90851 [Nephila pilipes]|uniref:Uncharacterized protein n=1 Tax=Nephila pilipes TaxID=299642 RepID=A0A8X6JFF7_NEPPI|nr:hypothetical protein NPIL_90851 [Nephila pilipes]